MENTKGNSLPDNKPCPPENNTKATGLDHWNDRLDTNLENENSGDVHADEKARAYSAEQGSGDQSDDS